MVEVRPITSRLSLEEDVQEVAIVKKVNELFVTTKVNTNNKLHVVKVTNPLEKVKVIEIPSKAKAVEQLKALYSSHGKEFLLAAENELSESSMDVKRLTVGGNGKFAVLAEAKDHSSELFLSVGNGDILYYSHCSYTVIAKDNRTFYTFTNDKDPKGDQVVRLNIRIPELQPKAKKLILETSCELKLAKSLVGQPLVVPGGDHIVMQVVNRQGFVEILVLEVQNDNIICKATRKQLGLSTTSTITNLMEIPDEPDLVLVIAKDEDENAGTTAVLWKINIEDDGTAPNGTVIKVFTDIYNKNTRLLLPSCAILEADRKEILWNFGTDSEPENITFQQWYDKRLSEENSEQTLKLYSAIYGKHGNFLETKIHFKGTHPSVFALGEFDIHHLYAWDSSSWKKYKVSGENKSIAPVHLEENEHSIVAVLSDGSALLIELSKSLASTSMADAKANQRKFHVAARLAGNGPKQTKKSRTCVLL